EQLAQLRSAVFAVHSVEVRFRPGETRLRRPARATVAVAAKRLRRLDELSRTLHLPACVTVIGYGSDAHNPTRNGQLAAERAASPVLALEQAGAPPGLAARASPSSGAGTAGRGARLSVEILPTGATCGEVGS